MLRRIGALAAVLVASCDRPELVTAGTAITDVAVVDVRSGTILPDRTVVFAGGRITALAPSADLELAPPVVRESGAGRYLIPGLWDMHVHLIPVLKGPEILPVFVAYGVTGVRDAGSQDSIFVWQREVASGAWTGPRMVAAGGMLVAYATIEEVGRQAGITPVQSETEARSAVRQLEGRAQYLKLQDGFLPSAIWLAAASEAREVGLPLAGHVPMDLAFADAIDAGLRSVEHVLGLAAAVAPGEAERRHRIMERARAPGMAHADILSGYTGLFEVDGEAWELTADSAWRATADLMARRGVALDPMLTDLRALATGTSGMWDDDPRLADLPAETKAGWRRQAAGRLFSNENSLRAATMLARAGPVVAELHRRGVVILAGTDAGSPFDFPGSDIHGELALLVDAGLTPLAALRAATLNPAVFMGMADSLGAIEPGMVADLVLLEGNPLSDIHNSGRIAAVVQAGHFFGRQALDSMLASARAHFRADATGR